ncbi:MAG: phosphotransferase [Roseburia sp.]
MRYFDLPEDIQAIVGTKEYSLDHVGMSDSEVRIYDDFVLKIQPQSEETNNEFLEQPEKLINLAAQGLKQLWKIDVKDCPYQTSRLHERLKMAEYNVLHNLVDLNNVEPETFGPNGFANPKELLNWLKNNPPDEDIVLTHGDYCLPNIFAKENEISGFIDIGKMGPADRWQDIAIAIRSLKYNFDGKYTGGNKIFDFKPQMFLNALGVAFDNQKYKYYILLDELF